MPSALGSATTPEEEAWVFAGTRLLTSAAEIRLIFTGAETVYGEIVQAAVTILAVATFVTLLPAIGPLLAGLLAFLIFAGLGAAMAWFGIEKARSGR